LRRVFRAFSVICPVLFAALAAGCTVNAPGPSLVGNPVPRGTVAFESIDGLPEGQFRRLVQTLALEAGDHTVSRSIGRNTSQLVHVYPSFHTRFTESGIELGSDFFPGRVRFSGRDLVHDSGLLFASAAADIRADGLGGNVLGRAMQPTGEHGTAG